MTDNLWNRGRRIDLQLFAGEGTGEPPAQGTTPAEPAEPITPEEHATLLDYLKEQMGEPKEPGGEPAGEPTPTEPPQEPPAQEPPQQTPQQEPEQLILGKFKTQKDLENAYLEEQRRITQYGQQFANLQQQWRNYLMARQQESQKTQQQQPQEPQLTPEQIQQKNEELYQRLQEKPFETLTEFEKNTMQRVEQQMQQRLDQAMQQYVAPMAQKLQYRDSLDSYTRQLEDARTKYQDFDELLPEMERIVQEQGNYYANVPNAIEAIYGVAKARTGQAQARPVEELIKDPKVREKLLSDPDIKNAVLKQYAQELKQGRPPSVIGSQPGETPATPPEDLTQPGSAKKATLAYFRSLIGGR